MKIEWKKSGDSSYVPLGDDTAASRHTIIIEQWGGQAQVQQEPLIRAANPFTETRQNVAGAFAFSSTKSHGSLDDAASAFITEYGRIGEKGELKITVTTTAVTYTNAILASVNRAQKEGVRLTIAYTFLITTGSIA